MPRRSNGALRKQADQQRASQRALQAAGIRRAPRHVTPAQMHKLRVSTLQVTRRAL